MFTFSIMCFTKTIQKGRKITPSKEKTYEGSVTQ